MAVLNVDITIADATRLRKRTHKRDTLCLADRNRNVRDPTQAVATALTNTPAQTGLLGRATTFTITDANGV